MPDRLQDLWTPAARASRVVVLILAATAPQPLWACKYSVRDVTFMEEEEDRYRLVIDLPRDAGSELRGRLEAAARSVLLHANVDLELRDGTDDTERATLLAPDGRSLALEIADDPWRAVEQVVTSPARREILDALPSAHSVVLVVGGDDGRLERATATATRAIAELVETFSLLPKAAGDAPRLVVVRPESRPAERVLLWALGVDAEADAHATHVAVLTGRTRRVGPILDVAAAVRGDLARALHVIGQDCECGLERSWMEGPMLPHRWSPAESRRALEQLGFDPQNPLVRSEIRRILARNRPAELAKVDRGGGTGPSATIDALVDPLLGYEEIDLAPFERAPFETAPLDVAPFEPGPPVAATTGGAPSARSVDLTLALASAVSLGGALVVVLLARRALARRAGTRLCSGAVSGHCDVPARLARAEPVGGAPAARGGPPSRSRHELAQRSTRRSPVIRFDNVSRTYPGKKGIVTALADVSLGVPRGQFVCVRGPSGCGKTTLLMTLGGMLRPSEGRVLVELAEGAEASAHVDLYSLTAAERARYRAENVGFVFQLFHLVPYLSVLENVLLGPRRGAEARTRAESLLEELGLSHRATHKPSELSIGERQRAAIARAILPNPPLLLADEPTGNLDPENESEVFSILERYHAGGGTIVVVTHGDAADAHAERHIRMDSGRVIDDRVVARSGGEDER